MEWEPIDSAPKDGTPVLVFCSCDDGLSHGETTDHDPERRSSVVVASWEVFGHADDGWLMCSIDFCETPGEPTHWMPLPPPPALGMPGGGK